MRIQINEHQKFALRVAGVFLRGESVLLHRAEDEDIWALPGGSCEFGEDTVSALIREAQEELDADVEVKSLALTVENFFQHQGVNWHEIGFYYHVAFTGDATRFYEIEEFEGLERHSGTGQSVRLFFQWIPLHELDKTNVKPAFLKERLRGLGIAADHIVHRDTK